jgi:hypothetical protein
MQGHSPTFAPHSARIGALGVTLTPVAIDSVAVDGPDDPRAGRELDGEGVPVVGDSPQNDVEPARGRAVSICSGVAWRTQFMSSCATPPSNAMRLAGRYQLIHTDVTVVHARVREGYIQAWCELPEGVVFDGVDNAFYTTSEYRAHLGVIDEERYTAREAAELACRLGAWAPDQARFTFADQLRTGHGV